MDDDDKDDPYDHVQSSEIIDVRSRIFVWKDGPHPDGGDTGILRCTRGAWELSYGLSRLDKGPESVWRVERKDPCVECWGVEPNLEAAEARICEVFFALDYVYSEKLRITFT